MFELLFRRCGEHSLLVTTVRRSVKWHAVFSNAANASLLFDRMAHTGHAVASDGASHPLKVARKRTDQRTRRRRGGPS
jgi:DNA replication protein DnaC